MEISVSRHIDFSFIEHDLINVMNNYLIISK